MLFTPLHRALGLSPTPLSEEILDAAIAAGLAETDDLDWKSELPPAKGISQTDVPKDIAAMANSGGGMIVYGVKEAQKAAIERADTGDFDEAHERAYRSAAITAISPPVFGLKIQRLGTAARAVAVVVPASVEGPHLIYRSDYFGAPIRNDADTVWMKERQIETMYRARFDERRRSSEAIDSLYDEAANGRDTKTRAWLIAAAHPRIPGVLTRPTRFEAEEVFRRARAITFVYSTRDGVHPLDDVEHLNPRPGLRRWTAGHARSRPIWREAWASAHHDGSVTLATAVGGHRWSATEYHEGGDVEGRGVECAVADFGALVRATAEALQHDEYDVRVGIEWAGEEPLRILTIDRLGEPSGELSTPLRRFASVRATLNAAGSDTDFHRQVHALAEDCVNQGGITYLRAIHEPLSSDS